MRWLALLLVALLTLAPTTQAVAQAEPGVVYLHDYLTDPSDRNCSNDVTAKIQAAENAWVAMQQARRGSRFELGSGCYWHTGTITFGSPDGAYIFGTVHGDGPNMTSFHNSGGIRALVFNELGDGSIGNFSVVGNNPGEAKPGCCAEVGVVMGNLSPSLGTFNSGFHNIAVTNEAACYEMGDPLTAGSAANNIYWTLAATHCGIGYHSLTYNTLNSIFINVGCAQTHICFYSDNAYGFKVWNGGGTNNDIFLYYTAPAQFEVDNWREESDHGGANGGCSQVAVLGGAQEVLTSLKVTNSTFLTTCDPAITTLGPTMLTIDNSTFSHGSISAYGSTVDIRTSQFGAANLLTPGQEPVNQCIFAVAQVNPGDGRFMRWFPNSSSCTMQAQPTTTATVVPPTPTAAPTSTPTPIAAGTRTPTGTPASSVTPTRTATAAPATATSTAVPGGSGVRWDGHGLLWPQTTAAAASMPISVSNLGGLRSTDVLYYEWRTGGQTVTYGDRVPLPAELVAQNGRLVDYPLAIVTPPQAGAYTLHVTLLRGDAELGLGLDVPETIAK